MGISKGLNIFVAVWRTAIWKEIADQPKVQEKDTQFFYQNNFY